MERKPGIGLIKYIDYDERLNDCYFCDNRETIPLTIGKLLYCRVNDKPIDNDFETPKHCPKNKAVK